MHIIDTDRIWYCIWSQPREISFEHGELMIYRWCLKEINRPLDPQVSLAPLINYDARVNSRLCSGQTTPAGPRAAALSWRIYAAPFPNAFIIPRCQRLAFSLVFVLLLSLLAPPVPLRLFLSSLGFCRTPGLLLYTTRTNTITVLTLALIRVHRLSFLLLRFPSQRGSDSYSFLAFTSSALCFLVFFFTSPRFLIFYIIAAALFGLGHKRPHIETTLRCWVSVILYNACNGCCDAPPDTLFPNVIYEGEMITRANVDDPFYQFT